MPLAHDCGTHIEDESMKLPGIVSDQRMTRGGQLITDSRAWIMPTEVIWIELKCTVPLGRFYICLTWGLWLPAKA